MASRPVSQASRTIPNLITLIRILLTPLFVIFLIQGNYRKALAVFLLAGVSDLADGLIARVWQQKPLYLVECGRYFGLQGFSRARDSEFGTDISLSATREW